MTRATVESLRRSWDDLARLNPLDSILARFDRPGDWALPDFFAEGEREIDEVLALAARHGLPPRRGSALDFGCGVGRLARALAGRFGECYGADLSPTMLRRAEEMNAGRPNLRFVQTGRSLHPLPDGAFDFVYTARTLQHVPSRALIRGYLAELVRVARPGGVLAIHLPTRIPWRNRAQPRARLYALLRSLGLPEETLYRRLRLQPMRMTAVGPAEVRDALARAGARVRHVEPVERAHEPPGAIYVASKG